MHICDLNVALYLGLIIRRRVFDFVEMRYKRTTSDDEGDEKPSYAAAPQ